MSSSLEHVLNERHYRAIAYARLRAENPAERAADIWAFVTSGFDGAAMNLQQFLCRHEWSSGYDDTDHEVAVYCTICGACGDA